MAQKTDLELLAEMDDFFGNAGIVHFTAREVCSLRKKGNQLAIPKRAWWPRMVPTLRLSDIVRARLGVPLRVGNGYRPPWYNTLVRGSKRSQHKAFRAVDLDLVGDARDSIKIRTDFYRIACEVHLELGREYKMGLGLYRMWHGARVHIDAGRWWGYRHWKKKYTQPLLDSLK